MNYVGINLHKHFMHFAVLNQSGDVLARARVQTDPVKMAEFLSGVGKPVRAALEATRNWYWVYDALEPLVEELKLASPAKMRVIAESTVKTDRIDAKVIADLLRTNFLPACYVPPPEVRQLRGLLRQRAFVVRLRMKVKNRIHGLLDKLGIRHPFENVFTVRGLAFLRSLELEWAYQRELEEYLKMLEFLEEGTGNSFFAPYG